MNVDSLEFQFHLIDRLQSLSAMEAELDKLTLAEACLVVGYGMASDRMKRVNGSGWWTLLARIQERVRRGA